MGEVWAARHDKLGKQVAIKLVRADSDAIRARLVREAMALANLRHPNVVEVHDLGEMQSGAPFVVMELLDGTTLGARLADGPLPVKLAVAIARDVASGLSAAHALGIIHRDVKPDNIQLATAPGGALRPVLIDFGIAADRRQKEERLTAEGAIVGTPEYMAPEQLSDRGADERTDVWGLGATLYEAIAGQSPFRHTSLMVSIRRIVDEPPSFPRAAEGLDGRLWALITRALRKDPGERFASAAELHRALAAWLATRGDAPATSSAPTLEIPIPAAPPVAPAAAVDSTIDAAPINDPPRPSRRSDTLVAGGKLSDDDDGLESLDPLFANKLGDA